MNFLIVTDREWYKYLPEKLQVRYPADKFYIIEKKEEFTYNNIKNLNPKIVFLPHWSHIVPEDIFNNFECIVFHMTDLPFGRGGSPLQNLIANSIYDTKISALKCTGQIDAGPIYLKENFSLYGNAEEIYLRAATVIQKMIIDIIANQLVPTEQEGETVYFKRRRPEDGNIEKIKDRLQLFDFIRMLDADGYPKAFLETDHFRFEFERASLKNGYIISDVRITRKRDVHE